MEALCALNINLVDLNMSHNKGWWIREDCRELLKAFLRKQEQLDVLNLNNSYFSSDFSENLLTTIEETPKLWCRVKILRFEKTLNFDSDATVN